MTFEWATVAFAEICEHSAFGPRFGGDQYAKDGNVATLRTTDISAEGRIEYDTMPLARLDLERFRNHILRVNDLVITRSGRIGTASVFKGFHLPVLPGAFLLRFRLDTAVADPFFYQYFFNSPAGQSLLRSVASGSVQQNLNITAVHQVRVPRPPLAQQRAIVRILRSLDAKIELNRRMNETLEATARALFKSWFIDFDPVRAKMEGRAFGLPKHLGQLFPDSFKDSELREIPTGWEVRPIKDCCIRIQNGGTPRRDEPRFWKNGTIPWLTSSEVRKPIITSTEGFITEAGLAESSAKLVDPFSTVIALYGATAGQVSLSATKLSTNQAVCALIPKEHYAFFNYLCMRNAVSTLENKAVGSAQQNISKAIVEETRTIFPSLDVLEAFSSLVRPFFLRWICNLRESDSLAALRDTLLPLLISGQLRVRDGEHLIVQAC